MIYFGMDLGQAHDYTALVATEKREVRANNSKEEHIYVRHAERFELGMPYPKAIEKLEQRIQAVNYEHDYLTIADYTGVGRPVIDMMREKGIKVVPITFTGGVKTTFDPDIGGWHVPKRDLVTTVQVLLQDGKLKFAKGLMHGEIMIEELLNLKAKITQKGNDTYEAWRQGEHDDLVFALCLAVWYTNKYGRIENKKNVAVPNPWMEMEIL